MKILHLCDSLNPAGLGGYESYLHYLSKYLALVGHESLIVAQTPSQDTPDTIVHDHYLVRYLPGNLLEARKWNFYALSEEKREREAARMFRKDDLELNVQSLKSQLLEVTDEFKPDIIHAHSTYVVFNRVLKSLKEEEMLIGIPMLATIHGRPKPLTLPDGQHTTDYESFFDACPFDFVLGVSDNVTEELQRGFRDRGATTKVVTCYLGIDLSIFVPQPAASKKWDIAFMGRLERMKSVDLFPEMLIILKQDFPALRFLVTGEGSLRETLLSQFEKEGVSGVVDYLGVVQGEDIPRLINQSRIFIYPSREEPFGLSILEAMACGVPVVTTNVYGPSEILTHNVDGLMVDPDDVNGLATAISLLLKSDGLRTNLGRNGRLTVEARFDIRHHRDELIDVYKMVMHVRKE
jgi:glycosyltransferase involved in cell wall biosynthesis